MSLSGFVKRNIYWANDFLHGQKVGECYKDLKKVLAELVLQVKDQENLAK